MTMIKSSDFSVRACLSLPCANLATALLIWFGVSAAVGQEPIEFNRQIRPILTSICFNCHGPDVATNEGGLRLDEFELATQAGDSGHPAIVPGSSHDSAVIDRIFDADDPMPPADFPKQLTEEQKQLLKRWVEQGAKYQGHWAFTNPTRPAVPEDDSGWARNPVDHFVLQRMKSAGLQPAPEASRRTLIRRLALDLTGLPPTPDEIANYLADQSPDAYEQLVDHYLASEAFGEKMARPWLDYARYADSNGFQSDGSRDIWAWREWVINAYNQNLPFDQFTIQQLAGDMLPNPTPDQIIATGFNRNHRLNGEGGRIVEEWFVETVIDRVETTGLTWLGLTLNCCRCHDHKYDPISQQEFYQLYAFFNSVEESGVLAPAGKNGENTPPLYQLKTPEHEQKLAEFDARLKALQAELVAEQETHSEQIETWIASLDLDTESVDPWEPVTIEKIECQQGTQFKQLADGSFLATGKSPPNPVYEFEFPIQNGQFSGLVIEVIPDDSLPFKFLGRSPSNGNFVLTDVICEIESANGVQPVQFVSARADFSQPNWDASRILIEEDLSQKNNSRKGWATVGFDVSGGQSNRLLLTTEQVIETDSDAIVSVKLYHRSIYAQHALGRFRIYQTSLDPTSLELNAAGLPTDVRAAAQKVTADRTPAEQDKLAQHFRQHVASDFMRINREIAETKKSKADYIAYIPTTMVMREGPPRQAFVLRRGEYDQPGDPVERALPKFLPPLPDDQPVNRLGLARWIVDESNPLTSRVWVNRTWQMLFGTGIVKSTENFGTQADFPTHPELLDWLAVEFRDPEFAPAVAGTPARPWDMKAMIKLLVTSATYRQSSRVTEASLQLDPENRLLARGSRFRLDAETIRDQALAASGLLVQKIGGPSVRPYMPPGVWDETSKYGNLRNYKADQGEGRYRRTLYTIWKRTAAPPTMLLFDAPNRETCTIKRSRTNTPLQALSLLNENTFVEAAQALAQRMVREGGDTPEQRIAFAFEWLTARKPDPREATLLLDGFQQDLKVFRDNPERATSFLKFVDPGYAQSLDEAQRCELAAYALTANVLLNLDEVVTRQ